MLPLASMPVGSQAGRVDSLAVDGDRRGIALELQGPVVCRYADQAAVIEMRVDSIILEDWDSWEKAAEETARRTLAQTRTRRADAKRDIA